MIVLGFNGHGQSVKSNTGVGQVLARIKKNQPEVETWLFSWRHNPATLAAWLKKTRPNDSIYIVGYSYGGYTAVLLCRELQCRGLNVEYLFTLDAVYRVWTRWGSLRSLLDYWVIWIPGNVKRLMSWRQRVSKPAGHRLAVDHRKTTHDFRSLNVPHVKVDNQTEVHDSIVSAVCFPPAKL